MPLSICNGNGKRRHTNKSKLKEVLLIGWEFRQISFGFFSKRCFIPLINTMVFELPSTYEEFAQTLMQRMPKNYKRVDLLADDYKSKVILLN